MMRLPLAIEDITKDWMTAALGRKYPSITVHGLEIRDVIHGACTKVRIALETNLPDFPTTVLMKAGFEPHSPLMGQMHQNEYRSYTHLTPTLDVQTPGCHFADEDKQGRALVILEDLCLRDVRFLSLQQPIGFDLARRFLDDLARIHARWWESPELDERFAWVTPADTRQMQHYFDILANEEEFDAFVRSPRCAAMPRMLLDRHLVKRAHEKMQQFHRAMPRTINHGDMHLGNLFVDQAGRPGFLDSQPCAGAWSIDVSYFLIAGLDMLDRRRWEGALLQHYLNALASLGVTPPGFDEAWLAYRRSVVWGLLIWMLNGSNFQTEANNTAAATRFAMAMIDLDTLAALEMA